MRKQYTSAEMRSFSFRWRLAWKILRGRFTTSEKKNSMWLWRDRAWEWTKNYDEQQRLHDIFTILLYPYESAPYHEMKHDEHFEA